MKKSTLLLTLSTLLLAEAPPLLETSSRSFNQSQFIPDISLIVDTSYVYRDKQEPEDTDKEPSPFNANEGFNLNYAEMVLSSSVDPYLNLAGIFHYSAEGVEIEEAYFTTTALEYSLRLRGGKMLSNFGRQNSKHHHTWDFADESLVSEEFFGVEGLNSTGAQLQWIAPTDTYLMTGVEVMQGDSNATSSPSLYVAYAKSSFDIGETIFFAGLSYAYNNLDIYNSIFGLDLTIKHYFDSYSYLSFQSEWMLKDEEFSTTSETGYYAQLVYAYDQNYRLGTRMDSLKQDTIKNRYSVMGEYNPSEFTRLRLQYEYEDEAINFNNIPQNQHTVILQANIAIGAHSAHAF